jgi:hypothetical protein
MSWLSLQVEAIIFIKNNYFPNYKLVPCMIDNIVASNIFKGGGRVYKLNGGFHLLVIDLWSAICEP